MTNEQEGRLEQMTKEELLARLQLTHHVIAGKTYHSTLPPELDKHYCYPKDAGHSILVVLPGSGPVEHNIVPAPVKSVFRHGYTIKDGYVLSNIPYSPDYGLLCEDEDCEYDEELASTNEPPPIDHKFFIVQNNGQLIENTNYWDSELFQTGYVFISVNERCVRLLLPSSIAAHDLPDESVLSTTNYVLISRGTYDGQDAFEVLFEDNSSEPYVIMTGATQWDRPIPVYESGRTDLDFHVYKNQRLICKLPARFRVVPRLPFLKPWE